MKVTSMNDHPFHTLLTKGREQGHTCLTQSLARSLASSYSVSFSGYAPVSKLVESGELVLLGDRYAARNAVRAEARIGHWLALQGTRASQTHSPLPTPIGVALSASQRDCWASWAGQTTPMVAALTGLPGSGKTWLVCELIKATTGTVKVAAPTGKAASVLVAKLGADYEVQTIHRLLGWSPGNTPDRSKYNPIDCDTLFLDESSMIDVEMMDHVLQACRPSTRVLLVGDHHQIAPVGAGRPFADMVMARGIQVYALTDIQRQSNDSGILPLSHAASSGTLLSPLGRNVHHFKVGPDRIEEEVVNLFCSDRLGARFGVKDVARELMILSAIRKGSYAASVDNLNASISHRLFPKRTLGRSRFTIGDRLMFTVNSRQYGFVNGEMGILESYKDHTAVITNDNGVRYELEEYNLSDWADHAYAVTVHKAQGSEFRVVGLVLHPAMKFMYNRNLLYTAMTRAKEELLLFGDLDVLRAGLERETYRCTALPYLIGDREAREKILYTTAPDLGAIVGGYFA